MSISVLTAVGSAAKGTASTVSELVELYGELKSTSPGQNSLTRSIKNTIISTRVVVDKSCASDEILPDVLTTIQRLYAGWVLTALQLEVMDVNSGKKVTKYIDTVATEKQKSTLSDIDRMKLISGMEAKIEPPKNDEDDISDKLTHKELPKSINLPSGQTIPLTIGTDGKNSISVDLLVLALPTLIDGSVFKEFFNYSFPESLRERWFKVRTGEIGFFKDFLFELDRASAISDAVKKDKSGTLTNLEKDRSNTIKKFFLKAFASKFSNKNKNASNTILIMDKRNFDSSCKNGQINFKDQSVRDGFFASTLSTAMVVIDTDYQQVDMYYAGISTSGTYPFKMFKTNAKDDRVDLQTIMKSFYSTMR